MNENTRSEWRELGFYYDRDDASGTWHFIGSPEGLARLAALLREYAANDRNAQVSEHDHLGPYMYLKIMTWHEPLIIDDGILGTLDDLQRLAALLERHLATATIGESFTIGTDYAPTATAVLNFEVREPGFDPATADPLLPQ